MLASSRRRLGPPGRSEVLTRSPATGRRSHTCPRRSRLQLRRGRHSPRHARRDPGPCEATGRSVPTPSRSSRRGALARARPSTPTRTRRPAAVTRAAAQSPGRARRTRTRSPGARPLLIAGALVLSLLAASPYAGSGGPTWRAAAAEPGRPDYALLTRRYGSPTRDPYAGAMRILVLASGLLSLLVLVVPVHPCPQRRVNAQASAPSGRRPGLGDQR